MSNIKNLEMADALSSKSYIRISNSFFGLFQKVIYVPTGSPIKVFTLEYSPEEGGRLEKLLSMQIWPRKANPSRPQSGTTNCKPV